LLTCTLISYIKFNIRTNDTITINLKSVARFPLFVENSSLKINCDTTIIFNIYANNPDFAEIDVENTKFRVFIYPSDTSTINLTKSKDSLFYRAPSNYQHNEIINFYFNKDKTLDYNTQWQILSPYFSDRKVVVINIFFSNREDIWKELIIKKQIKGVNLICKGKMIDLYRKSYNISTIPLYAIIDTNGRIIANRIEGIDRVKKIITNSIL
jgi:hypothetical protein